MIEELLSMSSHPDRDYTELYGSVKTANLIDNYIGVREWQDANMPIYGSLIGFDLILFLSRSRFQASPYSLKDVFHSLKYSEGALRIFLRRLEKDGWIRFETWPGDRRNKKIIVEDALNTIVEEYIRLVHSNPPVLPTEDEMGS